MNVAKKSSTQLPTSCQTLLETSIKALNITLSQAQLEQLSLFILLIQKWNKIYNLTAINAIDEMIKLHIIDSLAIQSLVLGERIIDIGTGAGLPGIPLAIACPDKQFMLLDSNAKKTRFVQQAIVELKLTNVAVLHQRVETYIPELLYDTAITRAFASLQDIIKLTAHVIHPDGQLLAMKGQHAATEIATLPSTMSAHTHCTPLSLPGVNAERCVIQITAITLLASTLES
ncbi:MAG: 16S rRNA (guanine(527)-N(7))-methyltransferase RsmG [Methylovulum sp.]|jgi:16S rRNA (guanine527-N7)-methyltransferase